MGNLSSSLLAWIAAREANGTLVLRIEDLDPPRTIAGAEADIISDLQWLGVEWDQGPGGRLPSKTGETHHQSMRAHHYRAAVEALEEADQAYVCVCSRREVSSVLSAPHGGFDPRTRYPGTCAGLGISTDRSKTRRFRAAGSTREWT